MRGFKLLRAALCLLASAIFLCGGAPTAAAGDHAPLAAELSREDPHGRSLEALVALVVENKDDWKLQVSGIRLLGETGNPAAAEALMRMFYDPFFNYGCPALRTSIAAALGNFSGEARVVDALLEGAYDGELQVREASIRSLGKIGDRRAVPYLLDKLSDRSFAVRLSAIRALGDIRDERAIPLLEMVSDLDQDMLIKNEARSTAGRIR